MHCKACKAERSLDEPVMFRDFVPVCPDCGEALAVEIEDETPDSPVKRQSGYPWFIGPVVLDVGQVS